MAGLGKLQQLIASGNLDEALGELQNESLGGTAEEVAQLWFLLGQSYEVIGRKVDAEIAYVRSLELNFNSAQCWNNYGVIMVMRNDDIGAEAAFSKAIELDPNFSNPRYNLQDLQIRLSKKSNIKSTKKKLESDAALNELLDRVKNYPLDANLWLQLAEYYSETEKFVQAKRAARKAARLDTNLLQAWLLLFSLYERTEKKREMLQLLRVMKATQPQDWQAWIALGEHFDKVNQIQEGTECYYQAVHAGPEIAPCWELLSARLYALGDSGGAIDALQKSIDLNNTNSQAWFRLGTWLFKMGDFEGARCKFETCHFLSSGNIDASIALAKCFEKLDDYSKSEQLYEDILAKNPLEPRAWNYLGVIFVLREEYESAEMCFQKALEIFPEYINPWYNLRDLYFKIGDTAAANAVSDKVKNAMPSQMDD